MIRRKHVDRPIGRIRSVAAQQKQADPVPRAPRKQKSPTTERQQLYLCQIRVDSRVLDAVKTAVTSAKLGGDFHYGNVSDFMRGALADYKGGLKLTEPALRSDHRCVRPTTVWLDETLYTFWRSLPVGSRREILERTLLTKLRRG